MTRKASRGSGLAPLAIAFVLGAALGAGVLWRLNLPAAVIDAGASAAKSDDCGAATYAVAPVTNAEADVRPASASGPVPSLEAEPKSDLRARDFVGNDAKQLATERQQHLAALAVSIFPGDEQDAAR